MKIRHLLISFLIIILLLSLLSLSGCTWIDYLVDKTNPDIDIYGNAESSDPLDRIPAEEEKALDEAFDLAEEEIEAEKEKEEKLRIEKEERDERELAIEEADLREGLEEEEELIPNEPITYSGEFDGTAIIVIINFKTTEVSGSVSYDDGNYWMDAEIVGIINIENFEVNAAFDGMCGSKEAGIGETWRGSIDGTVTGDLKTFNGTIIADDGAGGKFIASSNY